MSGGRYPRPHGRGYGLHDSLITKEIVRQACPCVSNHVPDTNFPLKNLDGPSQGVRDSNPLNSNKWFPPASASPTTRFILALPWPKICASDTAARLITLGPDLIRIHQTLP